MKKKLIIAVVILGCVLAILFVPLPLDTLDDGGTRVYSALTYKIVVWDRMVVKYDENGEIKDLVQYRNTSVFWLSDSWRSMDDLWEMESGNAR